MAKVLLLENEDIGKLYQELLSKKLVSHQFVWCKDITTAKQTIDDSYSVVIFDQRLDNDELGTVFMSWCKEKYPHIVGIMLSALVTKDDLGDAYNKGLIFKYLKKTKEHLVKLPEFVSAAIDNSECLRIMPSEDDAPELIGSIRSWRTIFSPMKVYKITDYVVNDEFVDDKYWETIMTIHAGQKTTHKRTHQTNHVVTVKCDYQMTTGISAERVNKMITKNVTFGANANRATSSNNSYVYTNEYEDSFEMPHVSSDPNIVCLSSIKIQTNRIYEIRAIGLKVVCSACSNDKYISCEVRIPTNREKHRKVMVYSDGSKKILDI